ncbi:MAG: LPS export ABC transporter ATP-binding protein [Holosporales bacterium]|jgi:lipopolysaccharide export system ATP-binding protein|nr:LPS export ABC transporter ATP-binding protein [Holosporales bacterium]
MIFGADEITKSYKGKGVLQGVSLAFRQREIVGILGPNGAGKTTLFSILAGIIPAENGRIHLNGVDITNLRLYERARKGIVYLPQDSSIFRGLSVEDNIRAVLQINMKSHDEIESRLDYLLESFSLLQLRKAVAPSLSGGERRKVEIARTLAACPKFLLLDEPFSGIDPISVFEIIEIIRGLKESGIGIIITDHNVRETLNILDRGYIIAEGTVLAEGGMDDILQNAEVRKTYLGHSFRI